MRALPGIDPGKLPVLAALAAGLAFTALLGATAAVYLAVDLLGALLMAGFLLAAAGLAGSGWLAFWGARERARGAPADQPRPPAEARDSAVHRLLEAVALEVKGSASTLSGFAGLLAAAPEPDPGVRRQILVDSQGLLAFAADLHDFIRCERGRLRLREQQVDAGELVAAALASCRAAAEGAGTTLVADVFDGVEITCDAERIGRALASLVQWAVSAATPGSLLEVRLRRLADGGLAMDVALRGEGAATDPQAERLFEPQFTGTGLKSLALPIARRVALLHAGEVTAASRPGEGISARLTLPAQRVAWPGSEEQPAARAA